jgi:hypothetical protein
MSALDSFRRQADKDFRDTIAALLDEMEVQNLDQKDAAATLLSCALQAAAMFYLAVVVEPKADFFTAAARGAFDVEKITAALVIQQMEAREGGHA